MDFSNIRNFEKVMKVFQYGSRVINASFSNKKMKYFYSSVSFGRRLLRAIKHLNVVRSILRFIRANWKNRKQRGFKFIYYACLYVFLTCDLVILLFKLKVLRDKKVLFKIFDFVDVVWVHQNLFGIIDAVVVANQLRNDKIGVLEEVNRLIVLVKEEQLSEDPKTEQEANKISGVPCIEQNRVLEKPLGSLDLTDKMQDSGFTETDKEDERREQGQIRKALDIKIKEKMEIDRRIIIQAKYVIKLFSEIFLAFGFLYSKKVGERVIGLSGLVSALSVF